jgi:hypothetical protein
MALVLANGQLAASSATILGAADAERTVAITLFNTSSQVQNITIAVTHGNVTVTVARVKLQKKYESAYITGLPLDPSSLLVGYATYAAAVDYFITRTPGAFSIQKRDEDGNPKGTAEIELQTNERSTLTIDGIVISTLLEEMRDLLLKIS